MSQNISPQSVSRVLHQGGLATVARHERDGLSVSKTHRRDQVHVQASVVGDVRAEAALILEAGRVLRARGYSVEAPEPGISACHLYVSKVGA